MANGITLILCFLAMTAAPYFVARRRTHPDSFVVGDRDYGWFSLTAGLSTTFIGGAALLNLPSLSYTYGWFGLSDVVPTALALIVSGIFLVPLIRSTNAASLGASLRRAGPLVSAVAGLMAAIVYALVSSAQILALARLMAVYIPLPIELLCIVSAFPIAAYIAYNGYAAVTITDRIQLIIMFALYFVLISAFVLLKPVAGTEVSPPAPQTMPLDMIFLLAIPLLFVPVSQDLHIRVQSARSRRDASTGCVCAGLTYLAFGVLSIFIGIAAAGISLKVESPDDVAPAFLVQLCGPLAILPMIAAMAAIVSTLDSVLFAASASLAYDVFPRRKSSRHMISGPVIAIICVGTVATCVAIVAPRILTAILSALIIYVAVMPGLLFGVYIKANQAILSVTSAAFLFMTLLNEAFGWAFPFRAYVICGAHLLAVLIIKLAQQAQNSRRAS